MIVVAEHIKALSFVIPDGKNKFQFLLIYFFLFFPIVSIAGHMGLVQSNACLLSEVERLQRQLSAKDGKLAETYQQLEAANARKQSVEKAIYRQLNKTHQVLKKAKGNLQHQKAELASQLSEGAGNEHKW